MPRRTLFVSSLGLAFVLALAVACGGGGTNAGETTRQVGAPEATATNAPPVSPTPEATQSGPARLSTSISGSCRITATGAEIRVEYSVTAFGSALVQRVRLLQDGAEVEDSGPLQQRQFRRVSTFKVEPGDQHTYRIAAEAPGAAQASVQSTVRCGTVPTASPGPRA